MAVLRNEREIGRWRCAGAKAGAAEVRQFRFGIAFPHGGSIRPTLVPKPGLRDCFANAREICKSRRGARVKFRVIPRSLFRAPRYLTHTASAVALSPERRGIAAKALPRRGRRKRISRDSTLTRLMSNARGCLSSR